MRRRLLLVLAIIGAVSIAGFAVPLIEVSSQARTRQFVQQRDSDVTRFAALSNEYVTNGNSARIADEISAYHEVYGDSVLIVSTRGVPDLSVGPIDEEMRAAVARGLRNERSSELRHVAPWGPDSAVFVAPVGSGAQVNGTAVLRSSTAATRADIGRWWLLIVGGAVVVVLAFAALAVALSRWVLRPLADLSDAMTGLAAELPVIPATVTEETNPTTAATRAGGPPEVRQLTDTFDGLVGAVLRSVEMQRQLVADTSHQLRNPLAALQFRLDIVESEIPDELSEDFATIGAETQRLQPILDKLLTLASAETPVLDSARRDEWCTAAAVLADRVEFWSVPVRERGARLTFHDELDDAATQARISEDALSQVIDVLVDNATRHAGPNPAITLSIRTVEDRPGRPLLEIEVADDGPGVADDDLPRLTERFFTRDAAHGTGLGLAIVDILVRGVGGNVEFGRSADGGLRVRVRVDSRLPATARSGDAADEIEDDRGGVGA